MWKVNDGQRTDDGQRGFGSGALKNHGKPVYNYNLVNSYKLFVSSDI